MKELIPLLSTIIGAAIAIISIIVQHTVAASKDRKVLLRNKLDEMGVIAGEIVFWVEEDFNSMNAVMVGQKPDDSIPRREYLKRLTTLNRIAKMYHLQLEQETNKFIEAVREYDNIKISFTVKYVERFPANTTEKLRFELQSYKEEVHPKLEQLIRSETRFLGAISKSMGKIL